MVEEVARDRHETHTGRTGAARPPHGGRGGRPRPSRDHTSRTGAARPPHGGRGGRLRPSRDHTSRASATNPFRASGGPGRAAARVVDRVSASRTLRAAARPPSAVLDPEPLAIDSRRARRRSLASSARRRWRGRPISRLARIVRTRAGEILAGRHEDAGIQVDRRSRRGWYVEIADRGARTTRRTETEGPSRPVETRRPEPRRTTHSASRTTSISATHAGLDSPSISMTCFMVTCLPAGRSSTATTVTWSRMRWPTLTGLGKRTLLRP